MNKIFQHALYGRLAYLFGAFVCFGSLAFAVFYLQDVLWLEPCPYCKLQRVVFAFMGTVFLIAAIFHPKKVFAHFVSLLMFIVAAAGLFISGKHIYIQTFPSSNSAASCANMSNDLIEVFDFEFVRSVLSARGDCGKAEHLFSGFLSFLTIPMLSFIAFFIMGAWGLYLLQSNVKREKINRASFR